MSAPLPGGALVARVALTDNTATAIIAAPGAGKRLRVFAITVSQVAAALTSIDLKDGTTAKWTAALAANGATHTASWNAGWDLTANTALNAQQSANQAAVVCVLYQVIQA
jgi:hypothetical protein